MSAKIIESVPNFSAGLNYDTVTHIVNVFQNCKGIKVLDFSSDPDHNRMVVTVVGEPKIVSKVIIDAVGTAIREIDLNTHSGQHPRIGAADVIPFIPLQGMSIEEADIVAKQTGEKIASLYNLPVYLYEMSASEPHRQNLADVRRGGFEGLAKKMALPEWKPDFGPSIPHPTAGATVIGARKPLIAFNVNLNTENLDIARSIARSIRATNGGFACCKALGIKLKSKNVVQVSVNLTDYTQTTVYQIVETIKQEAFKYGISICGTELIGLIPIQALVDSAVASIDLKDFSNKKILDFW